MKIKTTKITAIISSLVAIAVLCSTMFTAPQIRALDGIANSKPCVTYHGNGGLTDDYTDIFVSEGKSAAGNMFHKASSVFVSWNTRADGMGDSYTPGSELPADGAALDLYASWDEATFEITYDGNGGVTAEGETTVSGGQAKNGEVVVFPENTYFTREGYTFKTWNTKADGSGQTLDPGRKFQMVGRNITFYAMWTEEEKTPDQEEPKDSEEDTSTEDSEEDTSSETPAEDENTETEEESEDDTATEEEDGMFSVIYAGNGGVTAEGEESVISGKAAENDIVTFEAKDLFVYEGHTFVEWNTKADGSGQKCMPGKKFRMIGKDLTLYAIWKEDEKQDTDTAKQTPETDTSEKPVSDTEKKDTDTTAKLYALGYVIDSDNIITDGTYSEGQTVATKDFMGTLPEGKVFSHWSTAADDTGVKFPVGQTFAMPSSDVLLYAIYVDPSEVTTGSMVSYNSNYGDTDDEVVVDGPHEFREVVTAMSCTFEKPGYTFVCWNTEADGSGTDVLVSDKFYMPSSSVVLYARWAVNGSAEAEAARAGQYTSTTGSTYSGAVRTGVDNTVVFAASAVLIISLAVLVMCSVKGKKREE